MKIIFSITNGFLFLFAIAALFLFLFNLWNYGYSEQLLLRFSFTIFTGALFIVNIYSFWHQPHLLITLLQILLNIFLIFLILLILIFASVALYAIVPLVNPELNPVEIIKPLDIGAKVLIFHSVVTLIYIVFNMVKANRKRKNS